MPDPAFGRSWNDVGSPMKSRVVVRSNVFSPYFAGRAKEVVAVLFGWTTYRPERTLPAIGSVHSGPFASIVFCVHRPYF